MDQSLKHTSISKIVSLKQLAENFPFYKILVFQNILFIMLIHPLCFQFLNQYT
jgi:hypothetical protein